MTIVRIVIEIDGKKVSDCLFTPRTRHGVREIFDGLRDTTFERLEIRNAIP
jgi:hypothetical protein